MPPNRVLPHRCATYRSSTCRSNRTTVEAQSPGQPKTPEAHSFQGRHRLPGLSQGRGFSTGANRSWIEGHPGRPDDRGRPVRRRCGGPAIRKIDSHGRAALRRMQRCWTGCATRRWTGCATRRPSGAFPTTLVIRSVFREAEASFRQLEPSGPCVR